MNMSLTQVRKVRLAPIAQESKGCGISDGEAPSMSSPGVRPQATGARFFLALAQGLVKGFSTWLKSQVFCTMPEQLFDPVFPGQPPLSRWTAQIDRVLNPFATE